MAIASTHQPRKLFCARNSPPARSCKPNRGKESAMWFSRRRKLASSYLSQSARVNRERVKIECGEMLYRQTPRRGVSTGDAGVGHVWASIVLCAGKSLGREARPG